MLQLIGIVAMTKSGVVGKNNQLPWHLPADLMHFKRVTMNSPIIMGRKTFESIGRVLPGRLNIVLTRKNIKSDVKNLKYVSSKEEALALLENFEKAFVIGGAGIFDLFEHDCSEFYVTWIHKDFQGDVYFRFPDVFDSWKLLSSQKLSDPFVHEHCHYKK